MSWTVIGTITYGCICFCAGVYFSARLSKRSSQPSHRCARLDRISRETHAVRVYHVGYALPPSSFTEAEKNNLTFLRHLIASGRISDEV